MKQKIILLFLLLILLKGSYAQDKGFTLLLGPSVNYYGGDIKDKFSYTSGRLGWQINGTLGYISTRGGSNRGNMLGVFASGGSSKPEVIKRMQTSGAEIQGAVDTTKNFNQFYCIEGGMVISRFLRLSGGVGRQYYTYDSGEHGVLNYFSGTAGMVFNLGVVNWVIDANLMAGKNLNQNAIRVSTGFMVKF
jgi:hypothetical protein